RAPDGRVRPASSLGDAVAVFDDGNGSAGRQRSVQLAPGASASFTLVLRAWGNVASAAVELRSLGDPSRWDYMLASVERKDQTSLQVTPKRFDLTIQHGRSNSQTIEIANTGSAPLTDITLQPD